MDSEASYLWQELIYAVTCPPSWILCTRSFPKNGMDTSQLSHFVLNTIFARCIDQTKDGMENETKGAKSWRGSYLVHCARFRYLDIRLAGSQASHSQPDLQPPANA